MKIQRLKAIISTLLILCFLTLALTGALLYFGKTGVIWGISRNALRVFHFYVAIAICMLASIHLITNFRLFKSELRAFRRKDPRKSEKRR